MVSNVSEEYGAFVFRVTEGGGSMLSEGGVVIHHTAQFVPEDCSPDVRIWCVDTLLKMNRSEVRLVNAVSNGP
jgi:hypothetical protein